MLRYLRLLTLVLLCAAGVVLAIAATPAVTASAASGVDDNVNAALKKLYATTPVAKRIGEQARAVLVFPNIVKAGFVIGGQYGEGASCRRARSSGTTTPWRGPTACRPEYRSLAMRCS